MHRRLGCPDSTTQRWITRGRDPPPLFLGEPVQGSVFGMAKQRLGKLRNPVRPKVRWHFWRILCCTFAQPKIQREFSLNSHPNNMLEGMLFGHPKLGAMGGARYLGARFSNSKKKTPKSTFLHILTFAHFWHFILKWFCLKIWYQ